MVSRHKFGIGDKWDACATNLFAAHIEFIVLAHFQSVGLPPPPVSISLLALLQIICCFDFCKYIPFTVQYTVKDMSKDKLSLPILHCMTESIGCGL